MVDLFQEQVEKALPVLQAGGTILYPTDTIWGIGCDATSYKAVEKVFAIKERADSKSLIILVADERDILKYVAAPDPEALIYLEDQQKPVTVIYDHALGLPSNLVASDGSIAIRIVKDEFCRHLIKRLKRPIVSTSANISGQAAPQDFLSVSETIKSRVDHIVQWRQDDTAPAQPSRIIRWKGGGRFEVIRE